MRIESNDIINIIHNMEREELQRMEDDIIRDFLLKEIREIFPDRKDRVFFFPEIRAIVMDNFFISTEIERLPPECNLNYELIKKEDLIYLIFKFKVEIM